MVELKTMKIQWNYDNTIFVMASRGYQKRIMREKGFRVFHPYKDEYTIGRIAREIWFRIPFISDSFWYEKSIVCNDIKYIIVYDPQITVNYLNWLHAKLPEASIIFTYNNMVGKSRHLLPSQIPEFVKVWTYDDYDSNKFGLNLRPYFIDSKPILTNNKDYDVFFVGCDKGRGEWLCGFEKQLQKMGLKTKFIITKDGKFSRKKKYYQVPISYSEVLDYDSRSRAILNVVMENQEGVTQRDIESLMFNTKLITTNKHLKNKDFYNPNNIFILGEREIKDLKEFIKTTPDPVDEEVFKKHTFEHWMDVITESVQHR